MSLAFLSPAPKSFPTLPSALPGRTVLPARLLARAGGDPCVPPVADPRQDLSRDEGRARLPPAGGLRPAGSACSSARGPARLLRTRRRRCWRRAPRPGGADRNLHDIQDGSLSVQREWETPIPIQAALAECRTSADHRAHRPAAEDRGPASTLTEGNTRSCSFDNSRVRRLGSVRGPKIVQQRCGSRD